MTNHHAKTLGRRGLCPGMALIAALVLCTGGGAARAGELTISWPGTHDDVTAGYEVEVLSADGRVERTVDAGAATRLTVAGLSDGEVRRFRVRPYDRWGNRAKDASAELASLPAPRVDALEQWVSDGTTGQGVLVGANFGDKARAISRQAGFVVASTAPAGAGRLAVTVRLKSGAGVPLATDFAVINPVRRSAEFIKANPQLLDVDASGAVDEKDLSAVTAAFGAQAGKAGYRTELDVDGDGVIDGEDAAPIRAAIAPSADPSGRSLTNRRRGGDI